MHQDHLYYVYIVASRSRQLYIGVTNALVRRVTQHRDGLFDGYTKKYKVHRLVYYERFRYINNAIRREKEHKGWLREKKIALIAAENPAWEDLYPILLAGKGGKQILRIAQDDKVVDGPEHSDPN